MAWPSPGSAIFTQAAQNPILGGVSAVTAPGSWTFGTTTPATATLKVALYGNTGTPDKDAAVALTGYAATSSAWVTGNESTGTGYTAGGVTMGTKTWSSANGNPATFTLANSVAPTWTLTSAITANGDLVYNTNGTAGGTVVNQGFAMHSFGGAVSLGGSGGTFTIAWPTVNSVANTVFQLSFAYA